MFPTRWEWDFWSPFIKKLLQSSSATGVIPFEREKKLELFFKGAKLNKTYSPDFVCYDNIVVELKVVPRITGIEASQLINYLKVMRKRLGIRANFGSEKTLEWKQYVI